MEILDIVKRGRRIFDGNFSNRKTLLILLICVSLVFYIIPTIFRLLFREPQSQQLNDFAAERLEIKISQHVQQLEECDSHVLHNPPREERKYIAYIGNGYIGLGTDYDSRIFIKATRSLSLATLYRPVARLVLPDWTVRQATVTQYRKGIVSKYQALQSPNYELLDVSYEMFAHRTIPSLFYQNIKITNPGDNNLAINLERFGLHDWNPSTSETILLNDGGGQQEYLQISGIVSLPDSPLVIPVSIVTRKLPTTLQVVQRATTTFRILTTINYTNPTRAEDYPAVKQSSKTAALQIMKKALSLTNQQLVDDHVDVWTNLWLSGFYISPSKAGNVVNGDLINATIYNVLSQVTAPLYDNNITAAKKNALQQDLTYAEGCYGGLGTLQAKRLWSTLDSIDDVNTVVNLWLMTLEKQGCHQLLRAGADGVMQAMILSFGGLQFKNQHLEFNVDPQHLHRDYLFRRLNYGNATHLNVSVVVQDEDYKAVLLISLDRSDKNYYACDAGCLDSIKQLGSESVMFPVKLTQPLTAILYITSDKSHLEELKHAIHVHEIAIAPAHEQHVISLHRHGHKWGGLPAIFWVAIIALIVVFHLFLVKLIFNEYCGSDIRVRYRKLSDF